MILRYTRTDGRRSPAAFEQVQIASDGQVLGWRSVSAPAVGSFAGEATPGESADAERLASAVADLPAPAGVPQPGAPSELVELGAGDAVPVSGVGADASAWLELTEFLRALVERVVDRPYAAVTLEVVNGRLRLVHLGSAPVELDLSRVEVHLVAWRGDEIVETWTRSVPGPGLVTAQPGWALALPLGDDLTRAGNTAEISATFTIAPGARRVAPSVTVRL